MPVGDPRAIAIAGGLVTTFHGGAHMGDRTCSVDGCRYPLHARGLCATHNWRMKTYGSIEKRPRPTPSAAERFWTKVDKNGPIPEHRPELGPCWSWTASIAGGGYGWFSLGGKSVPAHRWSYEHAAGPIRAGLDLDHLCRVRLCVNPAHLEAVTRLENVRRGEGGQANARKTHCPKDHPYAGGNLLMDRGRRRCRICYSETRRGINARRRAQRAK